MSSSRLRQLIAKIIRSGRHEHTDTSTACKHTHRHWHTQALSHGERERERERERHTHTQSQTHTCSDTRTHTYTHIRTYARTHTHTHAHTRTHTHTYTRTRTHQEGTRSAMRLRGKTTKHVARREAEAKTDLLERAELCQMQEQAGPPAVKAKTVAMVGDETRVMKSRPIRPKT